MGLLRSAAKQLWHYKFPPLSDCRRIYAERTNQTIKWDSVFVVFEGGKKENKVDGIPLADITGNDAAF